MSGIIADVFAVALGGLSGAVLSRRLSSEAKEKLNQVFGICAVAMGVSSVFLMENMPAVVLAVVLGTAIGIVFRVGTWIRSVGQLMERAISRFFVQNLEKETSKETLFLLETAIILFCFSGTGIYGCLDAGMTGNITILLAKVVLDFFTAVIFASRIGAVVGLVAIPQFCVFTVLFLAAKAVYPLTSSAMINDFKAAGGFLLIATGCRIAKMEDFPIADMIPAMCIVMPISWLWSQLILPLL